MDRRPAAGRAARASTCWSSTTARPTAPARSPTGWRPPTPTSRVVHRTEKAGLGAAYLHGFGVALDAGYDVIGEMDADGSHQPEQLQRAARRAAHRRPGDRLALGAGRLGRQLAAAPRGCSRAAATSTSGCCSASTSSDATAGYRLFRRTTLEKIDLASVRLTGYVFQTDLVARTLRAGLTVPRGADRVRRARARRLQDERRRSPASRWHGSPAGACRARAGRYAAAERVTGPPARDDRVAPPPVAAPAAGRAVRRRAARSRSGCIIQVGQVIGAVVDDRCCWSSTASLGAWLIKREGGRAWRALRDGPAGRAGCRRASSPTAR